MTGSSTSHITRAMRCAQGTPSIRNDVLSKPIRRLVPPVNKMPATPYVGGPRVTTQAWRLAQGSGGRGIVKGVFMAGRCGTFYGGTDREETVSPPRPTTAGCPSPDR